jgi:hypothetical protein
MPITPFFFLLSHFVYGDTLVDWKVCPHKKDQCPKMHALTRTDPLCHLRTLIFLYVHKGVERVSENARVCIRKFECMLP